MLNAFKEIKKIVLRISAENWKLYKITKWKFENFIYIYMIFHTLTHSQNLKSSLRLFNLVLPQFLTPFQPLKLELLQPWLHQVDFQTLLEFL